MSSNNQTPCPNCSNHFTQHNPPRKLINCLHLLCQRCLISQKCCKKCGADIGLNDHFLKDYLVVSLDKNHMHCSKKLTNNEKNGSQSLKKQQQAYQERIIRELHEKTQIQNFCSDQFVVQQCLLHSKPADLICLEDRAIICSSCALFGKHKGHQITNREGILTKFASFIEDCLKIYDNLKQQSRQFSAQIYQMDYKNLLSEKLENDQKRISQKFQQIITTIKIIEKKQILKLREFYKQKQKTFTIKQQKIKKVETQVINWLTQIQNVGSLISDTTNLEKISDCIPFIDEKSKLQNQILEGGQKIMQKFCELKVTHQNQLDNQKQTDYLIFDQSKPKILEKYVSIKSLFLQKAENRTSLSLLQESPTHEKSPFIFQPQSNKKMKNSCKKQHLKTQSDAFVKNSSNTKTKFISQFQLNRCVDDNLLLSVQPQNNYGKTQQKSNIKSNGKTNNKPIIIQRVQVAQELDCENIPHLSISDIKPANISSGQSSDQSRFLQRDRELKQFINNDGFASLTVQISSSKEDQKKKKKIQFPEKFKGIVDDLKNDRAQIIDLTGAEVGDGSIISLCPFIKKSKKLKTLKLIKNKLTDDCLAQLFEALAQSKVCSLNLSQNLLTDKSCTIIQSCGISPNLKTITLSLNKINRRNVKVKIDELSKKNIAILL